MKVLILIITAKISQIITSMTIEYKRKDKYYYKNAYIIIAPYMQENLSNKNIMQYFTDVTYYVTPTVTKKHKIFSLLGFDILEKNLNFVQYV